MEVIEQSQILTTHNLAALVGRAGLENRVAADGAELARNAFGWIVQQQLINRRDWRSKLRATKNCAYALRQALFFLSMVPSDDQVSVVNDFATAVRGRGEGLSQLQPVVRGLLGVLDGSRFDTSGHMPGGGRRLLGWSGRTSLAARGAR